MTKFDDARNAAFRVALALYMRKLSKLVGDGAALMLAGTASEHTTLAIINGKAFTVRVHIACGKTFDAPEIGR